MTTKTTKTTPIPQDAYAVAAEATSTAAAAMDAATEAVSAAEQRAADLESALSADIPTTRQALEKARAELEKARADAEWSHITRAATEAAYRRATDAEAQARRRVVEDEYLRELQQFNDQASRENVLLADLTANVTELCLLLESRYRLHDRLATDVASWPADEQLALQQRIASDYQTFRAEGKPFYGIATHGTRALAVVHEVPKVEVAEAIKAGVAAARP